MAQLLKLPILGGLVLAGGALGMHLGNSSIAEINPAYFQDRPTRFHSDLAAYQSPASVHYAARVDSPGPFELGTGCIGCRTYPEEYIPQRDPYVDAIIEGEAIEARPLVQRAAMATQDDAALVERQARLDQVDRYARFAVSVEQQAQQAPTAAAAAVAQAAPAAAGEASSIQGDEVAAVN
jgi:hypothetical protein